MKHITRYIATALCAAALLAGCQRDEVVSGGRSKGTPVNALLTTTVIPIDASEKPVLKGDGTRSGETSRAGDEIPELYDYYVFQFDGEGDDAKMVGIARYVVANDGSEPQIVPLTNSNGANHRVVAVGNLCDASVAWAVTPGVTTYAEFRALAQTIIEDSDVERFSPEDGTPRLPMSATYIGKVYESNYDDPVTLDFRLNVARLTFTLSNASSSRVTVDLVRLFNMPAELEYTAAVNLADSVAVAAGVPPVSKYASVQPHLETIAPGQARTYTFYLPRNPQKKVADIGKHTSVSRHAPPGATYVSFAAVDETSGNRYITSLHVGKWSEDDGGTFDFDVSINRNYTLTYNIVDGNDYYLDERTDPYLNTNNALDSKGSGGYIRTGIRPGTAQSSIRYEIDYKMNSSASSGNQVPFGTGNPGASAGTFRIPSANVLAFSAGGSSTLLSRPADATTRHLDVFEIEIGNGGGSVTATFDGVKQAAMSYSGNLSTNELYLFGNNVNNVVAGAANMKIYSFRLWMDGVLVRDMHATDPFSRIDGREFPSPGLYDYVTQALFAPNTAFQSFKGAEKPFVMGIDTRMGGAGDRTFTLPFIAGTYTCAFRAEWGDDTYTDYPANAPLTYAGMTHTYDTAGAYDVSITSPTGEMPMVRANYSAAPADTRLKIIALKTPMLAMSITDANYIFQSCSNLVSVTDDLFQNNTQLTQLQYSFNACTSLAKLPGGLFKKMSNLVALSRIFQDCSAMTGDLPGDFLSDCPNLTTLHYAFYNCRLTGNIPSELLVNQPKLTTVSYAFPNCNLTGPIPGDLFANNPLITTFEFTFQNCKGLTSIPAGLFRNQPLVTTFAYTFVGCTGLNCPIPQGLFDDKAKCTSFSNVFSGCTNLQGEIPHGLFADSPGVTSFTYAFYGCSGLTGAIPGDLFHKQPTYTNIIMSMVFYGCTGLTSVPANLFEGYDKVTTFSNCFFNTGLTAIPAGLFAGCVNNTSFNSTFRSCRNLTSIPAGLFDDSGAVTDMSYAFYYSTNLTSAIPAGLFDHMPKVNTFLSTFQSCPLTGDLPARLFANCPLVTNFQSTFSGCTGLTGLSEGIFDNCRNVDKMATTFSSCSNISSAIPDGFFDDLVKATEFSSTFSGCSKLSGAIPAGLFAHTTMAENFSSTFSGCVALTAIPPDLFNAPLATTFQNTFYNCQGLVNPIPKGLFDKCPKANTFSSTFYGCWNLPGDIPEGLFDNCPDVTTFASAFYQCLKLTGIPDGLFANNLKATSFKATFQECRQLTLNANTFVRSETAAECAARFRAGAVDFNLCFYQNSNDATWPATNLRGTAPQLWNTDFYKYSATPSNTSGCFGGSYNAGTTYSGTYYPGLSNAGVIPAAWK